MTELAALTERVTRLEERVDDVHHLASKASEEVGDVHARLRAHTESLQALHDAQAEHSKEFRRLHRRIDGLDSRMRDGFKKLAVGQSEITALLNSAIDKR